MVPNSQDSCYMTSNFILKLHIDQVLVILRSFRVHRWQRGTLLHKPKAMKQCFEEVLTIGGCFCCVVKVKKEDLG